MIYVYVIYGYLETNKKIQEEKHYKTDMQAFLEDSVSMRNEK